ncbi:aminodeoxychorismate lyase [soil metagenome]
MKRCCVNGRPASEIGILDRSLHYGDGVFETMALQDGVIRLWHRHLQRLVRGCERLSIVPPLPATLENEIVTLTTGIPEGIVKLIITRGSGARGYAPRGSGGATRIILLYGNRELPADHWRRGVRVRFCTTRFGRNCALAGIKHLNRLEQVLARLETDDERADEGLMLDDREHVISGTMSNVFIVDGKRLTTPALRECGVEGVMRAVVLELAAETGVDVQIRDLHREEVERAQEMFVTNALIGIWPVRECAGRSLATGATTQLMMQRLAERGVRECRISSGRGS